VTGATGSLAALRQRLSAVAAVLLDELPEPSDDVARDAGELLTALVALARASLRADHVWILHAAVSGHLPLADDVEDLRRHLELSTSTAEAEIGLLRRGMEAIADFGEMDREMVVLVDAVLVDADNSARHNRHTGIQRVTRELCARWSRDHELTIVVWDDRQTALRAVARHEEDRVLRWSGPRTSTAEDLAESAAVPVVVPWRCTLVLPEVPQRLTARPLAALAQYSGNDVVAVGYDAIPVTSADLRPSDEPNMYVRYLNVIKHARRVAGISTTAAAEFRGFAEAVAAQGLPGPEVTEVMLAAEVPEGFVRMPAADPSVTGTESGLPSVVCVGSHEYQKNHLALLHAAELCWRSGLAFELTFIGGPGWASPAFDPVASGLARAGRPIRVLGNVTDAELWDAYRTAAFTVFPSVHEGFGLPVAESVACGTPAITTAYGSTAEIAARGGCLVIDPRDDHQLAAAIRTLLTEPQTHARLRAEAAAAPVRTWAEYASELWDTLIPSDGSPS
jgi:glycosyltransferase involved in cell wall biosynthesis